jgi:hypothetical protein
MPFKFRKERYRFVNGTTLQLTLREWRDGFLNPIALIVMAAVGGVMGMAGPFGTQDTVAVVPRILYWIWVVYSTYAIGLFFVTFMRPTLDTLPNWLRSVLTGCVNGAAISTYIVSMNLVIFGEDFLDGNPLGFFTRVFLIALFVTLAVSTAIDHLQGSRDDGAPKVASRPLAMPPLMERLPLEKRGTLMALSVEDHYVRIRTTVAETLVLMRLSDAIRETGELNGDQVHRSHWVNYDQVTAARREGDRAILTLADESEVPVSRSNLPKIKEAGLLPR